MLPATVYEDPQSPRDRRSLLGSLMRVSATSRLHQAEDQLTEVLAWLCDRDTALCRDVAELFLHPDDEEARRALFSAGTVGVRTQAIIPRPAERPVRPDLSIEGSNRAFQLLVEVKLDAEFSIYGPADAPEAQPEYYLRCWRQVDPTPEAQVRRLGTLTRDGEAGRMADPWRARDVLWSEVHALMSAQLSREMSPALAVVAEDFCGVLGELVLPFEADVEMLESWRMPLGEIGAAVARVLPEGRFDSLNVWPDTGYVGGYVRYVPSDGGERRRLWLLFALSGSAYCPLGWPSSLWIADTDRSLAATLVERFRAAGGARLTDRKGFKFLRAGMPVGAPNSESLSHAVAWATGLVLGQDAHET
jgi:hypothetical protein